MPDSVQIEAIATERADRDNAAGGVGPETGVAARREGCDPLWLWDHSAL